MNSKPAPATLSATGNPSNHQSGRLSSSLIYTTIAVVSASGLLFEFIQTRILSYIFWNHIVYLTISVALLGYGVSGTVVAALTRKRTNVWRFMPMLCTGMSLSLVFSCWFVSVVLPHLVEQSPAVKLMACYLVSVVPFVFAGAILSLIFSYSDGATGRLYFADLVAAGVGSLLFFYILPAVGAVPAIAALAALIAALGCFWSGGRERLVIAGFGFLAALLAIITLVRPATLDFHPESYKEMGYMQQHNGILEHTKWTTISRIDVVGGTGQQVLYYPEHPSGSYKIITQDGSAHTRLLSKVAINDLNEKIRLGKPIHPSIIPYSILQRPDVVIVGTGGGIDVAHALAKDANSVLGIELNPFTYRLTKDYYADWNGHLMSDPRVTAINAEGRSAIRRSSKKFDLVQVIAIDTFAALSSGAYVLSENYLYTVEAFRDYFAHLKPNGLISMYRWNFVPPKETLRLVGLAAEAWRQQGQHQISDRVMVIANRDWALTIFKNGAFTQLEADKLAAEADKTKDIVIYWPKLRPPAEQANFEAAYYAARHAAPSAPFNELVSAYESGTENKFFAGYQYKVTPTTDDSPFFFETSSLTDYRNWDLASLRGSGVQSTLFQIAIMATIIMAIAILLPLGMFNRQGLQVRGSRQFVVYFSALGLGFMTLEIGLMQKSVLILGNPMYSVPVLLTSILISAGVGSGVTARWNAPFHRKVAVSSGLLVIATAVAAVVLTFGAPYLLPLGLFSRAAISALCVMPVGVILGTFFPAGLSAIREQAPAFVPWAWGINGCASVYGSVLAIILAMWRGFNMVLLLGVCIYGAAVLAAMLLPHTNLAAVPDETRTDRIASPLTSD